MSEWITTGKMIDRLKIGEVAERKWVKSGSCYDRFTKIRKDQDGDLEFYNANDEDWECTRLSDSLIKSHWRIIPQYVSFEEAIKALKDGKTAYFEGNSSINKHHKVTPDHATGYALRALSVKEEGLLDLVEGKWII